MPDKRRLGSYVKCTVTDESFHAFVPPPLPPEPGLDIRSFQNLLTRASQAVGKLNGVSGVLPDSSLFLYFYVRKEAVLSSQIEGTQSSLSDLLMFESNEMPSVPIDDVQEVSRYVAALEHGLKRIEEGFPMSLRLIREMHEILLSKGRGSHKQPGEFRTSQNWIGGSRPGNARFVPPPPDKLLSCLDAFEKYLHLEERPYPSLIDAGLIHVQFETIHPFLDGNGRIGRLLITFFLILMGDLKQPWLYLSLFFRNHREEYYERLNAVRKDGDWEGWLDFFLQGVAETADQVVATSHRISELFMADKERLSGLKRAAPCAGMALDLLRRKAMISPVAAARVLGVSAPTARAALNNLKKLGIAQDIKGRGKERLYLYAELISLLESGPEPGSDRNGFR